MHNTGGNITIDNRFTLVETMKKNKPPISPELKTTNNREKFTSLFGFQKEQLWYQPSQKPNKNVNLMSSVHDYDDVDKDSGEKGNPK